MKKLPNFAIFLGVGLFAVQMVAGFPLAAQTAVVKSITGTVEVKVPGATEWMAASVGQALEQATVISTGFKSAAVLGIGNSTLTLKALTRLSLAELAGAGERVGLYLRAGRVQAEVKPPATGAIDFSVRSPSATASAYGTAFDFDGTSLRVDEGRVRVTGRDNMPVYVSQGHAVVADPDTGRTSPPAASFKESLVPPLPIGADSTAIETAAKPVTRGDLTAKIEWK
jgi:ferric-dicitrate binding protein FerR (iron transport regulator)